MLVALLFLPALVAIAVLAFRWRRKPVLVLAEAVPPAPTLSGDVDPVAALDALLADLEGTTVRLDSADELDERSVAELDRLAEQLEAAAATLERVGQPLEAAFANGDDVEADTECFELRVCREP